MKKQQRQLKGTFQDCIENNSLSSISNFGIMQLAFHKILIRVLAGDWFRMKLN